MTSFIPLTQSSYFLHRIQQVQYHLAQYLNVGEDIDGAIDKVGAEIGNYFLAGSNKPSIHQTNRGLTKEDFKKMSYAERAKLFSENNELYKALSN